MLNKASEYPNKLKQFEKAFMVRTKNRRMRNASLVAHPSFSKKSSTMSTERYTNMPVQRQDNTCQTSEVEVEPKQYNNGIYAVPVYSQMRPMNLENQFNQCAGHRRVVSYNYQPPIQSFYLPSIIPMPIVNQIFPMCYGGNRMQNHCCGYNQPECCCKHRQSQCNNKQHACQCQSCNPICQQVMPNEDEQNIIYTEYIVKDNQQCQNKSEAEMYPQNILDQPTNIANNNIELQVNKPNQFRSQDCEINDEEPSITSENDKIHSTSTLLNNNKSKPFYKNNFITQKTGYFTAIESDNEINKKANESEEIKMMDNMYNNTSEGMSPISKSKFDEQDFDNCGIKETPKGLKLGYTMNASQNKNKESLQDK